MDGNDRPHDYTLIRGGHVLTLDPQLGDLPDGDILVDGDRIVAVAPHIDPPDGRVSTIDATRMIVAPGLIDNHRHLWVSLLRGYSGDHTFGDYFRQVLLSISPRLRPDDVYLGCLLGAYEALDTGVTTVLDWNHGTYTREHALAAVRALRESGIRGTFAYSSPAADSMRPVAPPTAADLDAVQREVRLEPRLGLAVATRNPETADEAALRRIADDIGYARDRGVPVTLHTGFGTGRSAPQWLSGHGLLGPDTMLIHGNAFTVEDLRLIAEAGAWLTISPDTELQMGLGAPPLRPMIEAGLRPTVSVDVVAAATGDLRVQLRLLLQTQRLLDHTAGRVGPILPWEATLPYATTNAAASLGLAGAVGRLAPGLQADLVLIDRAHPCLVPTVTPMLAMLVAPAAAIDTVLVAGRVVKRHGSLTGVDLPALHHRAEEASRRLLG
jgi:5-methylthioadenosine/S-adenosylhomocysteine deaminase